ncbi:DNA polymerase III subunit gamma and tau [Leifsonia shinshuensis]|uniref:DNA polymerase III subunit gamma and tau n=1 Tax=Leifsonia shinshuensis TaxID=150026 RepID=UPI00285C28C1|nr:DNA polymerase III subunit gamma and tau [Leifsonia shinshuensis]MDR6973126.1 DNA polymerase-3 subunit gamma/tau [Leifsonia shinshuensis]
MVTALYRRYRPDTFAEMIGQSQVTEPLMTALRTNRVNHAYLFSGPRGCGKTTSARILARCLNCAEGPTDTPCGKCASCIELSRDGGGSLDVVEIDAASHNGVDDARDIRERAIFAPARDRYKIFILDEAHMVTPQGFNALLKIVEEPPEHVKFIFATTEPEKVIGTIRSRTHHYPFRLVPPAQMLEYVQSLCDSEGMTVAPGVLPLVVRAGGGSPRDTLSLLDQLMAGSEGSAIEYERAVALLGYTHAALLDEVIDAIAARDAAGAFAAVDRVIQTGQDPRRFVEDLLERLRDLIVVAATSVEGAAAVLRGVPQDELDRMGVQAMKFGAAELSRSADIVNAALTEMTGATSPRLHLELMIARVLVPSSDESERGALARVERLERRVGVSDAVGAERAAGVERAERAAAPAERAVPARAPERPAAARPAAAAPSAPAAPAEPAAAAERASAPAVAPAADAPSPAATAPNAGPAEGAGSDTSRDSEPAATADVVRAAEAARAAAAPVGPVTTQQVKDSWPQILDAVQKAKRSAWMVVFTAQVRSLNDDVLTLSFPSDNDVQSFRQPDAGGAPGVSEYLRQAIVEVLGIRVKFIARADSAPGSGGSPRPSAGAPSAPTAETWPGADAAAPAAAPSSAAPAPSGTPTAAPAPAGAARAASGSAPSRGADRAAAAPAAATPSVATPSVATPASAAGSAPVEAAVVTEWATVAIPSSAADEAQTAIATTAAVVTLERPAPAAAPAVVAPAPAATTTPTPAVAPTRAPSADEPPFDDVPPPETEPPFEPPVPEEPAGDWAAAPTPGATPSAGPAAAAPPASSPSAPASPSSADRSAAGARGARPASAPAAGSRTPTFQQPQRYGEAVVREILGATFIEEQPAPPTPGMR